VGESTFEDARALVTLRTEIPIDRVATPDAPEPEEEPDTGADPAATGDPMEGGAAQANPGAIVGGDGGGGGAITGGGGGGKGSGMRPGGPGRGPGGGMGRGGGNGRGGGPGRGGRGGGVPFRPPGGGQGGAQ
jgi:hypothetical protein